MKAVVDTNVIVSGLLNPHGPPAEVLRQVLTGRIKIIYDSRIFLEYTEVLNRSKFGFEKSNISQLLKELESVAILTMPRPLEKSLPDKNDNVFLETALAGGAEFIITGNSGHFPQDICDPVRVVTPAELAGLIRSDD